MFFKPILLGLLFIYTIFITVNVDRTVRYEICDNDEIVEDVVNTEPYFVSKELKSLFTIQDVKENMKDVFSAQGK